MATKNKAKVLKVVGYTREDNPNYVPGYEKLVTQGANKDFITVRVQQETLVQSPNGVLNKTKRTSRLTMPADLLEDIKEGLDVNTLLEEWGLEANRIIVVESFEPSYEGQSPKINPESHPTAPGEIILVDGREVYYNTKCVPWASKERDVRMVAGAVETPELVAEGG